MSQEGLLRPGIAQLRVLDMEESVRHYVEYIGLELVGTGDDGRVYLTQTLHEGKFIVRFTAGQFDCTYDDVMNVLEVLTDLTQGN